MAQTKLVNLNYCIVPSLEQSYLILEIRMEILLFAGQRKFMMKKSDLDHLNVQYIIILK